VLGSVGPCRHVRRCHRRRYWLADLASVVRLLELALGRLAASPKVLSEPLIEVILLCSQAPRMTKANEDVVHADSVRAMMNLLARALRAGEPRVELAAAETLLQLARAVPPGGEVRRPGDSRPSRWNMNHDMLRRSGAVELVAAAFAGEVAELQEADVDGDGSIDMGEFYRFRMMNDGAVDNDDDGLMGGGDGKEAHDGVAAGGDSDDDDSDQKEASWVSSEYFLEVGARLVRELSEHAAGAAVLTACGVPVACLEVLRLVASHKDPIVGTCLEVLWNLCEHSSLSLTKGVALSLPQLVRKHRASNAAHVLANDASVSILRGLFERIIAVGASDSEKALRNEIIIVATILARTPSPPREGSEDEADEGEARAAQQGTTPAILSLVESGMLHEALLYGAAAELDAPTPAARRLFASHAEGDLQLKLLLWELVSSTVRTELDHRKSLRAFARLRRVKDKRTLGAPKHFSRVELMKKHDDDSAVAVAVAVAVDDDEHCHGDARIMEDGARIMERAMLVDWTTGGPALSALQSSALVPAILTYLNPVDEAGSADPVVKCLAGLPEDEGDDKTRHLPPHPYLSRWSPDQKRRLELAGASVLRLIAPHNLPAVVDSDGCFVLALYLRAHSPPLRRRHKADEAIARASADAAREASVTGRRAATKKDLPQVSPFANSNDPSRVYAALRLIQTLCASPRGGAAISAEFGALGIVGDVCELLRDWETTVAAAPSLSLALSQPCAADSFKGDGAASPESGGPVPLGLLVEAACSTLCALCGGAGIPRRATTTAEIDEDEQTGAAETDGVMEALHDATRATAQEHHHQQQQPQPQDTKAPARGGAAGAGRQVFQPNQKALRAAGGHRLLLRWLGALAGIQRAEIVAREAEEEATAPKRAAVTAMPHHLSAKGKPATIRPARSATTAVEGRPPLEARAEGETDAFLRGQGQPDRTPTATATLLQRATTASGFAIGPSAPTKGSVAAGNPKRASSPWDGPPDAEAQLGACVVVAFWAALSGSHRATARAIETGCVDTLLDWLEVAPARERGAVLGLLADIALEKPSRAQFRAWKSQVDGGGALSLLMRCWIEEENRLGVRHAHNGEIADLLTPLRGKQVDKDEQDESTSQLEDGITGAFARLREALRAAKMWDSVDGQQAGADKDADAVKTLGVVSTQGGGPPSLTTLCSKGDIRPKIWAVLDGLGFDNVERGLAGDTADLPLSFRVALELCKILPEALQTTAWADLDRELQGQGLPPNLRARPIPTDQATLEEQLDQGKQRAVAARARQRQAVKETNDAVTDTGEAFFHGIRDTRRAVEESARLADQRRRAPQTLTFEERKQARQAKKQSTEAAVMREMDTPAGSSSSSEDDDE
jgi:hypothetical protein